MKKKSSLYICFCFFITCTSFSIKIFDVHAVRDRKINQLLNKIFDAASCEHLRSHNIDINSAELRSKSVAEKLEMLAHVDGLEYSFYYFPQKKREIIDLASIGVNMIQSGRLQFLCNHFLEILFDEINDVKTYGIIRRLMSFNAKKKAYAFWVERNSDRLENAYMRRFKIQRNRSDDIADEIMGMYNFYLYFRSQSINDSIKFELAFLFEYLSRVESNIARNLSEWEIINDKVVVNKHIVRYLKLVNHLWGRLQQYFSLQDLHSLRVRISRLNSIVVSEGVSLSRCLQFCIGGCC